MDPDWEIKRQIIKKYKDSPSTTGGRDKIFGAIRFSEKPYAGDISRRDVARFLAEDPVHQRHRPLNKRLTVRPILAAGPALIVQIDLVDMSNQAGQNGGYKYLLTFVDIWSKFAQVRAMKNKTQTETTKQLLDIIENMHKAWRPRTIQSDNGGEFGSQIEAALAKIGIKLIHSAAYRPNANGGVERFNRTIKSALYQLMTRHDTQR
ncbi:MAG: DDE-type integrase/transposase/recombinase, partial [Candidatus Pacebacteria bacterium]|nr:DDE-type integrase/transposase/recombinase [Candidatus Paceibacterota bacterium]